MRRALAGIVVGVQFLCACSTTPAPTVERQYVGRFSVVASLAGKRENGSGRFKLAVESNSIVLDLETPLGSTLARVEVDSRGARLTAPSDSGPREVHGADAEALTNEALGWPLPVAGFRDWIEGRPVPTKPSTDRTTGAGKAFEQDGWTISVLERFEQGRGAPRRLLLERPETPQPAPAISLRLVLDEPPFIR
ncbi:MAG TPA: outer membrane lipoprotein LolB [Burkholderiaceae bacterium]|nr:outer membrane lipoprotein LolB [Burkholderiaceae bacterium]